MGEPRHVLVESFDELGTGMRVVIDCRACGSMEVDVLGNRELAEVVLGNPLGPSGGIEDILYRLLGCAKWPGYPACVARSSVGQRRVFRFASDLGIPGQFVAEDNPYTSRSVVGTNGRDEVVVAARERTR